IKLEIVDEIQLDEIAINTDPDITPTEWSSTTVQGIELPAGEQKIRFHIQEGGPDLRAFRLVSVRQ
ncbi:hypothetical protein OAQ89_01070, partial [Balneolaceae bacterium]|nr:hypothetical protein [Balneolaceae bacterium]